MRNEKFACLLVLFFFFLNFFKTPVFAESSYVLPYPSGMPGNLSYKIHQIYEVISKYWYFGDFGQFDYNLKMSDKYLVEAKTLFEYRQYLLGYKALKKSDTYFLNIQPNLLSAERNGKDVKQKIFILNEAAQKHVEILGKMVVDNPSQFNWQPEKSSATMLDIKSSILSSINIRKSDL